MADAEKKWQPGWQLAALPLVLFLYLAGLAPAFHRGQTLSVQWPWVSGLGATVSFYADGLSLLFGLLIAGVGCLVLFYGNSYLSADPGRRRFLVVVMFFMGSMLGLVFAGDLITMFAFWELTSVSSYLLIGYSHERPEARSAALQALLVTGGGGLALLAGIVMLGQAGGTYDILQLIERSEAVRSHPLYTPALLLILVGAFTKSAQFPFHFWLPKAMEAPTPVSAYLHSATMVKAGVYLLARLSPVLGGNDAWHYLVTGAGAATMLTGAVLAFPQRDLKRILAYSTVSVLGMLVLLIGLDTTLSMKAAMVFVLVHSLYKAALFLVAGAVDHETGTRDVARLGGLFRAMPWTATAATLAALSMAGMPPMLGFIGKELLYEAKIQAPRASLLVTSAGVAANIIMVSLAAMLSLGVFFGRRRAPVTVERDAPFSLWMPPLLLACAGLMIGMFPDVAGVVVAPAVDALRAEETAVSLALWHGLNPVLALSAFTVLSGMLLYRLRHRLAAAGAAITSFSWGPDRWYAVILDAAISLARVQTRFLQSGILRRYVLVAVATVVGLASFALIGGAPGGAPQLRLTGVRVYEWALGAIMITAALAVVRSSSRLSAIAALGVVGYAAALIFLLYGAPDLAITQFAIETLSVILFVLVLYRLPRFADLSRTRCRLRDAVVAIAAGALMTVTLLLVTSRPLVSRLATFFAGNSVPFGNGRNIVNVILVDFRALDTLGEILVLATAAAGVYALLKARRGQEHDP